MVETRTQGRTRMTDQRIQTLEQQMVAVTASIQELTAGFTTSMETLCCDIQEGVLIPLPTFQDSDENQMCLRQKGNVKEFNAFFDNATSKLELTEKYLVITYVAGLKKAIADSVRLFHPRTMHEAKILAQMQEITIEMQTEKARKELEDQEKGGSCSTNTQEGSVDHKIPEEVQEDDEGLEASNLEQESKSHDEAQVMQFATEQNDDTNMSCSAQAPLLAMDRRRASNIMVEGGEAKNLNVCECFQRESHKEPSISAPSTTTSTLSTPILILPLSSLPAVFFLFLPSSPRPSPLSVSALSTAVVSNCFVPLGSFSSSISVFLYSCVSKKEVHDVMCGTAQLSKLENLGWVMTWLREARFEKSNL